MKNHLAQINISTLKADEGDPQVAEFFENLERINEIADSAPGFIWRLQTDEGDATDIKMFDNPRRIINISVWETKHHLRDYVYRSEHINFLRRRTEWFEPGSSAVALWWIPAETLPTVEESVARAAHLKQHGPTPHAFGFRDNFSPPEQPPSGTK